MPYKAARHFNVIPKGTDNLIEYKPGDYVLDFKSWPDDVQRTHINQRLVEHVELHPPSAEPEEQAEAEAEAEGRPAKGKRPKSRVVASPDPDETDGVLS